MQVEFSIKNYILLFGYAQILLILVVLSFDSLVEINNHMTLLILPMIASAYFTILRFIKDNKRVPTKEEKRNLIILSLFMNWIILFALFIIVENHTVVDSTKVMTYILILTAVTLISLNIMYGKIGDMILKNRNY